MIYFSISLTCNLVRAVEKTTVTIFTRTRIHNGIDQRPSFSSNTEHVGRKIWGVIDKADDIAA